MQKHYLERELQSNCSEVLEFLQQGVLDGLWYWDLERPANEWMSPRLWEVLGYDPATKKHSPDEWQALIFEEDLHVALEAFNAHKEDPDYPYDIIVRYRHREGHTVWIRCRGLIIRDVEGRPIRMLGTHTNVTDLMAAQQQVDVANTKLSQLSVALSALQQVMGDTDPSATL